jgi:hypothetical protein
MHNRKLWTVATQLHPRFPYFQISQSKLNDIDHLTSVRNKDARHLKRIVDRNNIRVSKGHTSHLDPSSSNLNFIHSMYAEYLLLKEAQNGYTNKAAINAILDGYKTGFKNFTATARKFNFNNAHNAVTQKVNHQQVEQKKFKSLKSQLFNPKAYRKFLREKKLAKQTTSGSELESDSELESGSELESDSELESESESSISSSSHYGHEHVPRDRYNSLRHNHGICQSKYAGADINAKIDCIPNDSKHSIPSWVNEELNKGFLYTSTRTEDGFFKDIRELEGYRPGLQFKALPKGLRHEDLGVGYPVMFTIDNPRGKLADFYMRTQDRRRPQLRPSRPKSPSLRIANRLTRARPRSSYVDHSPNTDKLKQRLKYRHFVKNKHIRKLQANPQKNEPTYEERYKAALENKKNRINQADFMDAVKENQAYRRKVDKINVEFIETKDTWREAKQVAKDEVTKIRKKQQLSRLTKKPVNGIIPEGGACLETEAHLCENKRCVDIKPRKEVEVDWQKTETREERYRKKYGTKMYSEEKIAEIDREINERENKVKKFNISYGFCSFNDPYRCNLNADEHDIYYILYCKDHAIDTIQLGLDPAITDSTKIHQKHEKNLRSSLIKKLPRLSSLARKINPTKADHRVFNVPKASNFSPSRIRHLQRFSSPSRSRSRSRSSSPTSRVNIFRNQRDKITQRRTPSLRRLDAASSSSDDDEEAALTASQTVSPRRVSPRRVSPRYNRISNSGYYKARARPEFTAKQRNDSLRNIYKGVIWKGRIGENVVISNNIKYHNYGDSDVIIPIDDILKQWENGDILRIRRRVGSSHKSYWVKKGEILSSSETIESYEQELYDKEE